MMMMMMMMMMMEQEEGRKRGRKGAFYTNSEGEKKRVKACLIHPSR